MSKGVQATPKVAQSTRKLPRGLHQFYISDKFTDSVFWFMAGLIVVQKMHVNDAAVAYRDFLQLDEDVAPTRTLESKFYRQLASFRKAIKEDRCMIAIDDDPFTQQIIDGLLDRIRREGLQPHRKT